MSKTVSLVSNRGERRRHSLQRTRAALLRAPALLLYGVLGVAGAGLWVMMQLPVGARAKGALVYAMAGCVGTFTLGWRLLRAEAQATRSR